MDTEVSTCTCLTNKWRVRIIQEGPYNEKVSVPKRGLGKMAKNQSLPARLQEKDSRSEDNLTMYEHHEKPTAW